MTPYPASRVTTLMRARKMQLKEFKNNAWIEIVVLITVPYNISDLSFLPPFLSFCLSQGSFLLKYQGKPFAGVQCYSRKVLWWLLLIAQVIKLPCSSNVLHIYLCIVTDSGDTKRFAAHQLQLTSKLIMATLHKWTRTQNLHNACLH